MNKILPLLLAISCLSAFAEEVNKEEKSAEHAESVTSELPTNKLIWNPPKEAVPTKAPPKDWKIEVFREKKYTHSHTLSDGTVVNVEVSPFILTPSNINMVYFLEPGYNPKKGMNHNMPESIRKQNEYIDKTTEDLQAIVEQLEKLREWVRSED